MNARTEVRGGIVLAVVALAYLGIAVRYPTETLANPGPGIFPLLVGTTVLALAMWQVVHAARELQRAARGTPSPDGPAAGDAGLEAEDGWKVAVMVALLVGYLLLVGRMGFLVSTAGVVVACSKLMNAPGWRRPLLLAGGVVVCCYVVFDVWLHVPLPRGLLP